MKVGIVFRRALVITVTLAKTFGPLSASRNAVYSWVCRSRVSVRARPPF